MISPESAPEVGFGFVVGFVVGLVVGFSVAVGFGVAVGFFVGAVVGFAPPFAAFTRASATFGYSNFMVFLL